MPLGHCLLDITLKSSGTNTVIVIPAFNEAAVARGHDCG